MSYMVDFELPTGYGYVVFSEDFKGSMERYLIHGLEPGGFATAMLACDLERALYNADTHNRTVYWQIAMWIRERCPEGSWGSYEAVKDWCKDEGGRRTKWVTWCRLHGMADANHDEVSF